ICLYAGSGDLAIVCLEQIERNWEERLGSMDRCYERRERLKRVLRASDAEAVFISSPTNVRYLTGFTGDSSVLLLSSDREIIVSDGRFTTQLAQECPDIEAHIRPTGVELSVEVGAVVQGLGWHRLAFEAASCTVAEHHAFWTAMPGLELI